MAWILRGAKLAAFLVLSLQSPSHAAGPRTVAEVLTALDGQVGDVRRQRLIEMARVEGGITVYTSNPAVPAIAERILKDTAVPVQVVQAGAQEISTRLFQEHQARQPRADVVEALNPSDRAFMTAQGMFAKYSSPLLTALPKQAAIDPYFIAQRWTVSNVAWNTAKTPAEKRPKTLEDLAQFKGSILFESRQTGWLMAVNDYYKAKGWSEDKVTAMLANLANGALITTGQALTAELLAAGQAAVIVNSFHSHIETRKAKGAPVEWIPVVAPVTLRPNGALLMANAPHPAGAVLYQEYMLEHLGIWSEFDQLPVTALASPPFSGMDPADIVVEDPDRAASEEAKWRDRLDAIVRLGKAQK